MERTEEIEEKWEYKLLNGTLLVPEGKDWEETLLEGCKNMKGWIAVFVVTLLLNLTIGGIATEYVVEFWAPYLTGKPVDVPFLHCAIAGLFLGEFTIPAAIITWILSFLL